MQGPGLTCPSQRWRGLLSPLATPGPLGQVTLQPIGCSLGAGDPNLGVSTMGVTLGRALKSPMVKRVPPSISGLPGLGSGHLCGKL